jgi:16S rRNA (guanine(1405)-N(7))-methyltransferase
MDEGAAFAIALEAAQKSAGLKSLDESGNMLRTRAYKDYAKEVRKKVYYALRKYETGEDLLEAAMAGTPAEARARLLESHASTKERLADLEIFKKSVLPFFNKNERVLDVGCGVNPLIFSKEEAALAAEYVGIDKAKRSVDAVNACAIRLGTSARARVWDLADGWEENLGSFGLALVLKVAPVVLRLAPELGVALGRVPAKIALFTAATESMTRRESVARRERAVLEAFLDKEGFTRISPYEASTEFGWFAKK